MGTQIHASNNYRRVVETIGAGIIGPVAEVHCWCNKGWSGGKFSPPQKPPANLDWDLWLGPAAERPYSPGIHPANWRRFWDYGSGTLGATWRATSWTCRSGRSACGIRNRCGLKALHPTRWARPSGPRSNIAFPRRFAAGRATVLVGWHGPFRFGAEDARPRRQAAGRLGAGDCWACAQPEQRNPSMAGHQFVQPGLFSQVCPAWPVYADHLVENLGHGGNRLVDSSRLPNEVGVEGAEDHAVVLHRAASMQLNKVAAIVGQQDTAFGNSECKNLRVWYGRVCSSSINLRASAR